MCDAPASSVTNNATATADANTGVLYSVGMCAGADAATVTVRTGGSGGTVIAKLGCAAGLSDSRQFLNGISYSNLHVTVTGTTPTWEVEIAQMG